LNVTTKGGLPQRRGRVANGLDVARDCSGLLGDLICPRSPLLGSLRPSLHVGLGLNVLLPAVSAREACADLLREDLAAAVVNFDSPAVLVAEDARHALSLGGRART
jgi:hypothetical protein